MAKVIIFGVRDTAELAHFYLENDSEHEVVGFSLTEKYIEHSSFKGLPVIPFENIEEKYPPDDFRFFVPMTYRKMNKLRAEVYGNVKEKGYNCISYISSKATVYDTSIIGENCFILEDNTIQPFTPIGNNVVLWSGNHIGHHGKIKDHVFFTSHVVLSGHCVVEPYSVFGVNSTIQNDIHIKEGTFVAMDASIARDTEPWSLYKGVPGKKVKDINDKLIERL